jgi:hypothetical protein
MAYLHHFTLPPVGCTDGEDNGVMVKSSLATSSRRHAVSFYFCVEFYELLVWAHRFSVVTSNDVGVLFVYLVYFILFFGFLFV